MSHVTTMLTGSRPINFTIVEDRNRDSGPTFCYVPAARLLTLRCGAASIHQRGRDKNGYKLVEWNVMDAEFRFTPSSLKLSSGNVDAQRVLHAEFYIKETGPRRHQPKQDGRSVLGVYRCARQPAVKSERVPNGQAYWDFFALHRKSRNEVRVTKRLPRPAAAKRG